jgi:hypothetical protein
MYKMNKTKVVIGFAIAGLASWGAGDSLNDVRIDKTLGFDNQQQYEEKRLELKQSILKKKETHKEAKEMRAICNFENSRDCQVVRNEVFKRRKKGEINPFHFADLNAIAYNNHDPACPIDFHNYWNSVEKCQLTQ